MEPDPVWGMGLIWNPDTDIGNLIQADSELQLGLLQTWAYRPSLPLTWEKSGIAQDPEEAMMATDLEPQPDQMQALSVPTERGAGLLQDLGSAHQLH